MKTGSAVVSESRFHISIPEAFDSCRKFFLSYFEYWLSFGSDCKYSQNAFSS